MHDKYLFNLQSFCPILFACLDNTFAPTIKTRSESLSLRSLTYNKRLKVVTTARQSLYAYARIDFIELHLL